MVLEKTEVARSLVAAVLVLAGCSGAPPSPPPSSRPPTPAAAPPAGSLHDRLGGETAIRAVVDDLLARATANPAIAARFEGANVPRLREKLVLFVIAETGGPRPYKGRDMRNAHAGMGITDAEFDALGRDLVASLGKFKVPAREAQELLAVVERTRKDIVERRPTVEERLAMLEVHLARIERKLDQVLSPVHDLRRAGAPGEAAAAAPLMSAPPAAPAPAPAPKRVAVPKEGPKPLPWTAEEQKLAQDLIARYGRAERRAAAGGEPRGDLIGRRLEETRFLSSSGDILDLRDFEGKKKVVLVILRGFSGYVCLHCSAQTLALADAAGEFRARGAEVILVYPGEAATVPTFIEAVRNLREGFTPPFPIALDVDFAAVRTFRIEGSLAKPTSLVIDERGIVRYAYVGKQPADRPSVDDLLAALDRAAKGP